MQNQILLEKLSTLPPQKLSEVENFVDFLREQTQNENQELRYRTISEYVAEHAGSDADFDEELEQASVEFLAKDNEK